MTAILAPGGKKGRLFEKEMLPCCLETDDHLAVSASNSAIPCLPVQACRPPSKPTVPDPKKR